MPYLRASARWYWELASRLIKPWPDPVLPFDPDGAGVRLYALGTSGSAPARQMRQTSSYLVEKDGYRVLVDAGTGLFMNYPPNRNPMRDLDAIALTHLHPDHTGDLDQFVVSFIYGLPGGVARNDISEEQKYSKMTIYGPRGTADYIKARLNAHSDAGLVADEVLRKAFDFVEWDFPPAESLADGQRYTYELTEGLSFTAVPVKHLTGPEQLVPAYGFRFEAQQEDRERPWVIGFSGDTVLHPNLNEIAQDADFFVCDVAGPPVHMTAEQAAGLCVDANVKVLGGTHVMPWIEQPPAAYLEEAQEIFDGPVKMLMSGTCFEMDEDVGLKQPISLSTGQPVGEYEEFLFLQGMDPTLGQYRPRGVALRTLPGIPNDPDARRERISTRRFMFACAFSSERVSRSTALLANHARGNDSTLHIGPWQSSSRIGRGGRNSRASR